MMLLQFIYHIVTINLQQQYSNESSLIIVNQCLGKVEDPREDVVYSKKQIYVMNKASQWPPKMYLNSGVYFI